MSTLSVRNCFSLNTRFHIDLYISGCMNDIEAYAELIRTVRDKYPKALIFCLSAVLNLVMTAGDRIVGQSDKETTYINR